MILSGEDRISIARGTNIGYFSQELDILDPNKTILDNIMKDSIQTESVVRTILARLLFKRDEVFKKCNILSGGERVKASFAKLLVSNANLLILDEPTNYLDLTSIEALSFVLSEYNGALLFISHDRRFIDSIAEKILLIEDSKIKDFDGNLSKYNQYLLDSKNFIKSTNEEELFKIEHRISFLIGKLSTINRESMEYEVLDKELLVLIKQKMTYGGIFMDKIAINIENLNKSYSGNQAVNNISVQIFESECFGFLGPNGAGKTTTMKMIYGKSIPDKCENTEIDVFGYDPLKESIKIKFISGIVPQQDNLDLDLSVEDKLRIYSKFYGIPKRFCRK